MARPYSELRKMVPPENLERAEQLAKEIIRYMSIDEQIHLDIFTEMERQFKLQKMGKFKYTLSDSEMSDLERLGATTEEFLEAFLENYLSLTRAVNDNADSKNKRAEIIQVIACCWQWLRHIDNTEKLKNG